MRHARLDALKQRGWLQQIRFSGWPLNRVLAYGLTMVGWALVAILACNAWVIGFSKPYTYDHLEWVPQRETALVLGTSPYTSSGSHNLLFDYRMNAAAQLLRCGKVERLLLSGSNPGMNYNEPRWMYDVLREKGVADEVITMDFAGVRTLDSVVRANKVFGLDRYTIVSQRFHNYRAVFLARHKGIRAIAYSWPREDARQPLLTEAREYFSRVKAVLDLFLLHTKPRYSTRRPHIDRAWNMDAINHPEQDNASGGTRV